MRKLKLMTVVGTRPEIIKMSEIMKVCDEAFDHTIVHTGQNYDYELNQVFFEELGIRKPDYYLNVVCESLGETLGNVIAKSYDLMSHIKPDALIILGDTNSCLCAIAAKRLKIPIFHMEAGNRCFDENLPEEVNRRIVDTTSDINLCYTEQARQNLLSAGFEPEKLFVVGSPMREILAVHQEAIDSSLILEKLKLEKRGYILLSAHREENLDNPGNFEKMVNAINGLAEEYKKPIWYSLHPRSRKRIKDAQTTLHPYINAHKPFGFIEYNHLQKNAFCVVSDSGTLAEESAILQFPAVSLRTSTERPEAIDAGGFVLGSLEESSVIQSVNLAVDLFEKEKDHAHVRDYFDINVSAKVAKIIQSYTGIIMQQVWGKEIR